MDNDNLKKNLEILQFALGPAMTNAYLVGDPATKTAVVVDPAWNGDFIASKADERNWKITAIWLTHAHFDHFGGVAQITNASEDSIPVALHPEDLPLWELHGGAAIFGFPAFDPGPAPTILLDHGLKLRLGNYQFEVRHTPGHTQGHVIFVLEKEKLVFCGDLIFMQGVGRTDLPGGDWDTLLRSIKENILTLPDDFRLLSGHGPETTVGQERLTNPFLYELR